MTHTPMKVFITMRAEAGMVSSTVYMSFANRFKMRPSGVVSKNDIGEYKTVASMRS